MIRIFINSLILMVIISGIAQSQEGLPAKIDKKKLENFKKEIETGRITYRLSEPEEIRKILGKPLREETESNGGVLKLFYYYPEVLILFLANDKNASFTIFGVEIKGEGIDIGSNRKLVLRNEDDLRKLDNFWGFQNVSLKNINLSNEAELIRSMTFDTLTEWPSQDKLPLGFQPDSLLENGKTPGLGIRELHKLGITGKGVGIAIIDQPLLLGHDEYTSSLVRYDATGLKDIEPQMHGSPIASIAVGKNIGVAPDAALSYFAVPMWKDTNEHYIKTLKKIIQLNAELPKEEKIRVVSISDGMFSHYPDYNEWKEALLEAEQAGILVITCGQNLLNYGSLNLIEGRDPDDPNNYVPGVALSEKDRLRIPIGNKTTASHRGIDVYTYYREAGFSWAPPYIAGLAALAFQVNNDLKPKMIIEYMINTVTKTQAGPVVNPRAFIERVKQKN